VKRYLPFAIVIAVALVTLATGTMLYRAKRLPILTIPKKQGASEKEDLGHVRGDPNAPVTLEEFGDFQCPPCGKLAGPIDQLERDYHSRLRVIFHNYPLPIHQHAREAAFAAEAAGMQDRFWEMHDLLYREQSVWSKTPDVRPLFNAYAGILGLNVDRFKQDMESEEVKARVALDQKRAAALGVTTTPTIFINNHAVAPTALNQNDLRSAIDDVITVLPSS
jgi:protein-disulfide isomerase